MPPSAANIDVSSLRKQLREEELKLVNLRQQLDRELATKATKSTVAAKKFSLTELSEFQRVFNEIDTDENGTLSVKELSALAKRLGVEMTEKQLKEQTEALDTNGDGVLSFDEFVGWWASEAKSGGPSSLQLFLLKTKMKAEMVRKRFHRNLAVTPDATEDVTVKVSANVTVGSGGGRGKSCTSMCVAIVPIDVDTFKAAMQMRGFDPDTHQGLIEIKLSLRAGVDLEDVEATLPTFQGMLTSFAGPAGLGDDVSVVLSDDKASVLIKIASDAPSVLDSFLSSAAAATGRQFTLSDVLDSAHITLAFNDDISSRFEWDVKKKNGVKKEEDGGDAVVDTDPVSSLFDGFTAALVARVKSSVIGAFIDEKATNGGLTGLASLAVTSSRDFDATVKYDSLRDVRDSLLRSLEGLPIRWLGGGGEEEEAPPASDADSDGDISNMKDAAKESTDEESTKADQEMRRLVIEKVKDRLDFFLGLTATELLAVGVPVPLHNPKAILPPSSHDLLGWQNWGRPESDRANWKEAAASPEQQQGSDEDSDDEDVSGTKRAVDMVVSMLSIVDGITEISMLETQASARINCNNLNIFRLLHLPSDEAKRGELLRKAFIGFRRKCGAAFAAEKFAIDGGGPYDALKELVNELMEMYPRRFMDVDDDTNKLFKLPPISCDDEEFGCVKDDAVRKEENSAPAVNTSDAGAPVAANNTSDAPADNTSDAPADNTSDVPAVNTSDVPADNTSDAPANNTSDAPADNTSDVPAVNTSDAGAPVAADNTSDVPADNTNDAPADNASDVGE